MAKREFPRSPACPASGHSGSALAPRALYAGIDEWPASQRNLGRFLFLHPAARDIYADWDSQIRACVARMRALAGTEPDAPDLAALAGESPGTRAPEFARLWDGRSPPQRKASRATAALTPFWERVTAACPQPQSQAAPSAVARSPVRPRSRARAMGSM